MSRLHQLKLALVAAGLLVFFYGIRNGVDALRWTGIGLVTLAWLLRFAGRFTRQTPQSPEGS